MVPNLFSSTLKNEDLPSFMRPPKKFHFPSFSSLCFYSCCYERGMCLLAQWTPNSNLLTSTLIRLGTLWWSYAPFCLGFNESWSTLICFENISSPAKNQLVIHWWIPSGGFPSLGSKLVLGCWTELYWSCFRLSNVPYFAVNNHLMTLRYGGEQAVWLVISYFLGMYL